MLDLVKTPFSYAGSYMALAKYEEGKSYEPIVKNHKDDGIYLKSLRGKSREKPGVFKFEIMRNGQSLSYNIEYKYNYLRLYEKDFEVRICFIKSKEILLHVQGENISLTIDTMPESVLDYSFELRNKDDKQYFIVNSYKSQTKYFIRSTKPMSLTQEFNKAMLGNSKSLLKTSKDNFDVFIQEIPTHLNTPDLCNYDYDVCEKASQQKFQEFVNLFKKEGIKYPESYFDALYTTWSAIVEPSGQLKREVALMSNTNFPGLWSWDHCFNALAFMEPAPKQAYDNLMILFDFQDEWGQLPGSVSDSNIHWNFAKPPIHGFIIGIMLRKMDFTSVEKEEMYYKLMAQVNFWLTYKDSNSDGIAEYHHGNDSGYDNSTVFSGGFCVDSPDLTAYLVVAFDTLESLANDLGVGSKGIRERKNVLISKFKEHFLKENTLVARDTLTQKVIENESILPYNALMMSEHLPKSLINKLISDLKESFITPYGLATEKISSQYYESDGYWRGPIWAPEMIILIESIEKIGDTNFAKLLIENFIKTVERSGFSENFDATSGQGLRDPAHTWTSSSYVYLYDKLLAYYSK